MQRLMLVIMNILMYIIHFFNFLAIEQDVFNGDIYQAKYDQFIRDDNELGQSVLKNAVWTSLDPKLLLIEQKYPNYTNFKLDYLGMSGYSSHFTNEYFWNNFLLFLQHKIALMTVEHILRPKDIVMLPSSHPAQAALHTWKLQ